MENDPTDNSGSYIKKIAPESIKTVETEQKVFLVDLDPEPVEVPKNPEKSVLADTTPQETEELEKIIIPNPIIIRRAEAISQTDLTSYNTSSNSLNNNLLKLGESPLQLTTGASTATTSATTASDWQTAANNIVDQVKANDAQADALRTTRNNLQAQADSAIANRDRYPPGSANYQYWQDQARSISNSIVSTDNALGQIATSNLLLTQEYNNAIKQAEIASQSAPSTVSNTPPANPNPGNNTDTPPTNVPQPAVVDPESINVPVEEDILVEPNVNPANIVEEPVQARQDAQFLEANLTDPAAVSEPSREQEALLEANLTDPANIINEPLAERQNEAFLEANLSEPSSISEPLNIRENEALLEANFTEPANIVDEPLAERQNAAFLEANMEPATIEEPLRIRETESLLEANQEPATINEPLNIRENEALLEANAGPESVTDEPLRINETEALLAANQDPEGDSSLDSDTQEARVSGKRASESPFPDAIDWRFRISLAPQSNYLYKASDAGILTPLQATNGVLYPYTPQIQVTYSANYEPTDLAHTNYKIYNYKNSSVDNISITGDFTAQDTFEANYMLAVIHFFRSVTKMFYGQDQNPIRGTPPPLCYLSGHGTYAFDNHPVAITSFSLNYPNDVDYINAGANFGATATTYQAPKITSSKTSRLHAAKLQPGGLAPSPGFTQSGKLPDVTRVPTKLQITISCIPIVTRYNISNNFSLKEYATGKLLKGSTNSTGGGIW